MLPAEVNENKKQKELEQEKLNFIEEYINEGTCLATYGCPRLDLNEFCNRCNKTFRKEIAEFDAFKGYYEDSYEEPDLDIMLELLKKYKLDFQLNKSPASITDRSINFNNQNNSIVNVKIGINQAVYNIMDISEKELSNDDKIKLVQMLKEIEKEKNKKSLWEKVKVCILWVLEKGVETSIATLPYLLKIIQ